MNSDVKRKGRDWPLLFKWMSAITITLAALDSSRLITVWLLIIPNIKLYTRVVIGIITIIKYGITMSTLWYLNEACACAVRSEARCIRLASIARGLVYTGVIVNVCSPVYFWILLPHRALDISDGITIPVLFVISLCVLEIPAEIFLFLAVNKINLMNLGVDDLAPRTYSNHSSSEDMSSGIIHRSYSSPARLNSYELYQHNARSISGNIKETSTADKADKADKAVQTNECIVIVIINK